MKRKSEEIVIEFNNIPNVTVSIPITKRHSRMKTMSDALNRLDRQKEVKTR